ncbi:hypothetical protein SUGI_0731940 [Cryptomeria japonica]|nr:hypothetical protein SUGI_0731940 [Cryptomeria japonica]
MQFNTLLGNDPTAFEALILHLMSTRNEQCGQAELLFGDDAALADMISMRVEEDYLKITAETRHISCLFGCTYSS